MTIWRVNWHVTVGGLSVEFGHLCARFQLDEGTDSIVNRNRVHGERALGIPSLTLAHKGEERSKMKRYCPGWWHFGRTPNRLVWKDGKGGTVWGPATGWSLRAAERYLSMTSGCSAAYLRGRCEGRRLTRAGLKPIWKPSRSPVRT